MYDIFNFSELGSTGSPLEELAKDYKELPNKDRNKPIEFFRVDIDKLNENIISNKREGLRRENEVFDELGSKYPKSEGYIIQSEAYLRDSYGYIAHDPETMEGRRIDFVVIKKGEVVEAIEVTSNNADKVGQSAKEQRIRDNGGNYIRTEDGALAEFPHNKQTRIERRA